VEVWLEIMIHHLHARVIISGAVHLFLIIPTRKRRATKTDSPTVVKKKADCDNS
jgi:hypothetical protein